jgi:hypothetical protein
MQWLSDKLQQIIDFLRDFLLYIPKWLWQHVLEAIQGAIAAIPVPDAFTQFTGSLASIPSGVVWFLTIMQFQFGVSVIVGAMAARFLMKFIPTLSF